MDIVIFSVGIYRNIVVAVTGDAKKFGIFVEAVSATSVRNQGEKVLRSQIVDPWKRSIWGSDDIFLGVVIEITEFHKKSSCFIMILRQLF